MAAQTGKTGRVKYTSAAYSTAAGEGFTSLSGTTDRTEFRVTDGAKRHWTRDIPPVVLVNSTAHTDFTYNPVQGKLTFTGAPLTVTESGQVTATVYWHTAAYLPQTYQWAADVDVNMHDVTAFSTSATEGQWRTFTAGLQGGSVDLSRYVEDGSTMTPEFYDRLNTGTDLIVELQHVVSGTTHKWEAYGRVSGDGFSMPRDGVSEESVTLTIDDAFYYASTE